MHDTDPTALSRIPNEVSEIIRGARHTDRVLGMHVQALREEIIPPIQAALKKGETEIPEQCRKVVQAMDSLEAARSGLFAMTEGLSGALKAIGVDVPDAPLRLENPSLESEGDMDRLQDALRAG